MHARINPLFAVTNYRVFDIDVNENQFVLPFPILATEVGTYPNLTDVTKIEGALDSVFGYTRLITIFL